MPAPTRQAIPTIDLATARTAIRQLADERAARGTRVPPEQLDAAAALLVDLWASAARHAVTPEQWGWQAHLPRAALDTIIAAHKYRQPRFRRQDG